MSPDLIANLTASELRYRRLFETAQDGILIIDFLSGKIQDANPFLLGLLGYSKDEVLGKALWEIGAMIDKAPAIAAFSTLKTKQGQIINVEIVSNAYDVEGTRVIQCNIRDITARQQAECDLLVVQNQSDKRNWAVSAYGQAAMALFHAETKNDLIQNVCNAIAEQDPYIVAWVGLAEHDVNKTVRVAGAAGSAKGYTEGITVSWSLDTAYGRGPSGQCIRSGKTIIISDTLTNADFQTWIEHANQYGIRCCIATPITRDAETIGALMVYAKIPNAFIESEVHLFENLAEEIGYGLRAIAHRQQLKDEIKAREAIQSQLYDSLDSTIEAMSKTLEFRDPYTAGHQNRVADIATAIGVEMGLDEDKLRGIHLGCLVHDIGKVSIPSELLTKPTHLTDLELQMIRLHAEASFDILKNIPFTWPIAEMAHQHHERLDGSGYPRGLKADEIIFEARILAVADTIDAMSSHRPYRAAIGLDAALKVIQAGRGTLFDETIVDACLRLFKEQNYQLPIA